MDETKAIELYNFFVNEGYDLGNQDIFFKAFKDEKKRVELYDFFVNEGYDVGEVDKFVISSEPVVKTTDNIATGAELMEYAGVDVEEDTAQESDGSFFTKALQGLKDKAAEEGKTIKPSNTENTLKQKYSVDNPYKRKKQTQKLDGLNFNNHTYAETIRALEYEIDKVQPEKRQDVQFVLDELYDNLNKGVNLNSNLKKPGINDPVLSEKSKEILYGLRSPIDNSLIGEPVIKFDYSVPVTKSPENEILDDFVNLYLSKDPNRKNYSSIILGKDFKTKQEKTPTFIDGLTLSLGMGGIRNVAEYAGVDTKNVSKTILRGISDWNDYLGGQFEFVPVDKVKKMIDNDIINIENNSKKQSIINAVDAVYYGSQGVSDLSVVNKQWRETLLDQIAKEDPNLLEQWDGTTESPVYQKISNKIAELEAKFLFPFLSKERFLEKDELISEEKKYEIKETIHNNATVLNREKEYRRKEYDLINKEWLNDEESINRFNSLSKEKQNKYIRNRLYKDIDLEHYKLYWGIQDGDEAKQIKAQEHYESMVTDFGSNSDQARKAWAELQKITEDEFGKTLIGGLYYDFNTNSWVGRGQLRDEKSIEQADEIDQEASQLSDRNTFESLIDVVSQKRHRLEQLAKIIGSGGDVKEGMGLFGMALDELRDPEGVGFFNSTSLFNLVSGTYGTYNIDNPFAELFENDALRVDLEKIKKINEVGIDGLGSRLSFLPGKSSLAMEWNEALKEYLVTNKAVALKVDPTSNFEDTSTKSFFTGRYWREAGKDFLQGVSEGFFNETYFTEKEQGRSFVNAVSHLDIVDDSHKKLLGFEYNPETDQWDLKGNTSENVFKGVGSLVPFIVDMAITKQAALGTLGALGKSASFINKSTPISNFTSKFNLTAPMANSLRNSNYYKYFNSITTGAIKEGLIIAATDEFSHYTRKADPMGFGFGAILGASNTVFKNLGIALTTGMYSGYAPFLPKFTRNFLTSATYKLTKPSSYAPKTFMRATDIGGRAALASGVRGLAMGGIPTVGLTAAEIWTAGMESDTSFAEAFKHATETDKLLTTFFQMYTLGMSGKVMNPGGGALGLYRGLESKIMEFKGEVPFEKEARNLLGLKPNKEGEFEGEYDAEEIENAYNTSVNNLFNKLRESGLSLEAEEVIVDPKTGETLKERMDKLDQAKNTLYRKNNIKAAQKAIKADEASKQSEQDAWMLTNKILTDPEAMTWNDIVNMSTMNEGFIQEAYWRKTGKKLTKENVAALKRFKSSVTQQRAFIEANYVLESQAKAYDYIKQQDYYENSIEQLKSQQKSNKYNKKFYNEQIKKIEEQQAEIALKQEALLEKSAEAMEASYKLILEQAKNKVKELKGKGRNVELIEITDENVTSKINSKSRKKYGSFEEVVSAAKEGKLSGQAKQIYEAYVQGQSGFMDIVDKTGKHIVIVNKNRALENNNLSAIPHELIHVNLSSLGKEQRIKVLNEFAKELRKTPKFFEKVTQNLKDRGYDIDGKSLDKMIQEDSVLAEEFATVFFDQISSGRISPEKTTTEIKDVYESGKDLYNSLVNLGYENRRIRDLAMDKEPTEVKEEVGELKKEEIVEEVVEKKEEVDTTKEVDAAEEFAAAAKDIATGDAVIKESEVVEEDSYSKFKARLRKGEKIGDNTYSYKKISGGKYQLMKNGKDIREPFETVDNLIEYIKETVDQSIPEKKVAQEGLESKERIVTGKKKIGDSEFNKQYDIIAKKLEKLEQLYKDTNVPTVDKAAIASSVLKLKDTYDLTREQLNKLEGIKFKSKKKAPTKKPVFPKITQSYHTIPMELQALDNFSRDAHNWLKENRDKKGTPEWEKLLAEKERADNEVHKIEQSRQSRDIDTDKLVGKEYDGKWKFRINEKIAAEYGLMTDDLMETKDIITAIYNKHSHRWNKGGSEIAYTAIEKYGLIEPIIKDKINKMLIDFGFIDTKPPKWIEGEDFVNDSKYDILRGTYTEMLTHIRNFNKKYHSNPYAEDAIFNDNLFAWITREMKNKTLNAWKELFTEHYESSSEAVGDQAYKNENYNEAKDYIVETSLRRKIGLGPEGERDPFKEEVFARVKEILQKRRLPNLDTVEGQKEFKKVLQKEFENALFEFIREKVFEGVRIDNTLYYGWSKAEKPKGGIKRGNWNRVREILEEYGEVMYNKIPTSELVSMSRETISKGIERIAEPVIDPSTGKQKKAARLESEALELQGELKISNVDANNRVWKKRNWNDVKEDWIEFFFNPAKANRGERVRGLSKRLAQEIGFDATMEILMDPKTYEEVQGREIQEVNLMNLKNNLEVISRRLYRNPNMRFSRDMPVELLETRDLLNLDKREAINATRAGLEYRFSNDVDIKRIAKKFNVTEEQVKLAASIQRNIANSQLMKKDKDLGFKSTIKDQTETFHVLRDIMKDPENSSYDTAYWKGKEEDYKLSELEKAYQDLYMDIEGVKAIEQMVKETEGVNNIQKAKKQSLRDIEVGTMSADAKRQEVAKKFHEPFLTSGLLPPFAISLGLTKKSTRRGQEKGAPLGFLAYWHQYTNSKDGSGRMSDPWFKALENTISKKLSDKTIESKWNLESSKDKELKEAWDRVKKHVDAGRLEITERSILESGEKYDFLTIKQVENIKLNKKLSPKQRAEKIKKLLSKKARETNEAIRDLDFALSLTLQKYLHSKKGKDFKETLSYIYRERQTRDRLGDSAMAASKYWYLGEKSTTKEEHLRSVAENSAMRLIKIADGEFNRDVFDATVSDYSKIFGPKEVFDVIDKLSGQNSRLGKARFLYNLPLAKKIFNIETGKSLYEEILADKSLGFSKEQIEKLAKQQEKLASLNLNKPFMGAIKDMVKGEVKDGRQSRDISNEEVLSLAATMDAALELARDPNTPVKKIRVFDFDDTLAQTKSNVLYTMPDGTKGKLTAEEFAKKGDQMSLDGAVWDFSEFNKVVDGKPGPLLEVAKTIQRVRGTEDVFVLTARSPEAAKAIYEFLNSVGLNIPLENITGLGNSSPFAKSNWVIEKAAEGYNDFYFADDHAKNVEAVQDALDQIRGLKTRTQLALPQGKIKSEPLNKKQADVIDANSMRDIDGEATSDGYLNVRFSKNHRAEYEKMLEKRRPDLKGQIPEQVEKVFEFVDDPAIPQNKRTKFEKLALHYLSKGFLILPEDGYKVIEAERLASVKKIDPFSFSNPNEIIEKFAGEVKGKRINPDTMSTFSNKRSLEYGITVYDVANTREAQQQVRSIIDTHWGKNSNPWCLAARSGPYDASGKKTMGEQAWEHWENYGEEKQIAFKDGKLVAFRDGDAKQWWDKLDRPSYSIEVRGPVEKTEKSKNAQGDEVKTKTRFIYKIEPETGVKERGDKEVVSTYKNKDGKNVSDATITKSLPSVLHQALGKNVVISKERKVNGKKDGKQYQLYIEENAYLDLISFLEKKDVSKKGEYYTLDEIKQAPMGLYYDSFPSEAFEIWDKGNMVERKSVNESRMTDWQVKHQNLIHFRGEIKETTTYEIKKSVENDNNIWRDTKNVVEETEGLVNNIYELSKVFGASGVTIKRNNYKIKFNKDGVIYRELNGRKFLTEYDILMQKVLESPLLKDENLTESVGWYYNDMMGSSIGNARNVFLAKMIWDKVKVEKEGIKKSYGAILEVEGLKDKNFKNWAFDRFDNNKPMGVENKIVVGKEVKKVMKREKLMQGRLEDILYAKKTSLENEIVPLDKNLKPTSRFSMDTKMDLEWEKTEKPGPEWEKEKAIGYKTEFNVGDNKFIISMAKMYESEALASVNRILHREDIYELDGEYFDLDFAFIDKNGVPIVDMTGIMGPEGGKVLSIVANGVLDFVKKNKNAKGLYFSSALEKRTRIYKGMSRMFGNELGWGYKIRKEEYGGGLEETNFIVSAEIPTTKNLSGQRQPVRDVINVVDKSSRTQQSRQARDIDLSGLFNKMIEIKTGIPAEKKFDMLAKSVGRKKGKGKVFMPYSTEDFKGLMYPLIAKGKVGDAQLDFMNEVLFKPFNRAMNNVSRDRMQINADFRELKRSLKNVPKNLTKEAIPESGLTYENVVRLYLWDKQGIEIDGVSAETMENVWEIMQDKPELQAFADQLLNINKGDGYYYPGELWLTGNMTSDLYSGINKTKRAKYLKEWTRNKNLMFNKENMLKLEAAYGAKYVESLRDILRRMETGVNRPEKSSRFEDMAMNYINGSVGVTMFFNTRSAILQTISTANYINWSDNNLYNVGKAYANAPQFAKDFLYLMKSDFMKDRRSGLKINVSESEIADAAKKKGYRGVLNLLLQSGFSLTKAGDAFAIAFGGAPFYRNRIKTYLKEGFSLEEAERKAFDDFREITEESQQSARTDKISMQQADKWGRIILAFANTPMQYNRLIKRAAQDLINGRGDWKSNTSRIVYYLGIQNFIFNALSQALFAMSGEADSEENIERYSKIGNSMLDSILRGSGYGGALIAVLKNFGAEMYEQSKADRPQYRDAWIELLGIAPPVQAKVKRLNQAGKTLDYNQKTAEEMGWEFSLDNPNYQSIASWVSGVTNIPLDRFMRKADNVNQLLNDDWETWQKVMMMLGWNKWDLETTEQEEKREKEKGKTTKKRRKQTYNEKANKKNEMLSDFGF